MIQSAPTEGYRKLLKCLCRTNNHIRENIHTCNLLSVTKGILVVKAFLMNLLLMFFVQSLHLLVDFLLLFRMTSCFPVHEKGHCPKPSLCRRQQNLIHHCGFRFVKQNRNVKSRVAAVYKLF